MRELETRIDNLIVLRRRLRERFSSDARIDRTKHPSFSPDGRWVVVLHLDEV